MIKAVLWDFGGVITSSPFEAFNRFEESRNFPKDIIRKINSTNPESNAWALLESSKISVDEFDARFAEEACGLGHEIRGAEVLALLSGELRPEMIKALQIIKSTHQIGCITNNVRTGEGPAMTRDPEKAARVSAVMELFDIVIESSKVGVRKPDPAIYQLACEELGIETNEAIFLDDLGVNLKPARELGMVTIKVLNAAQALKELEDELGISLR